MVEDTDHDDCPTMGSCSCVCVCVCVCMCMCVCVCVYGGAEDTEPEKLSSHEVLQLCVREKRVQLKTSPICICSEGRYQSREVVQRWCSAIVWCMCVCVYMYVCVNCVVYVRVCVYVYVGRCVHVPIQANGESVCPGRSVYRTCW